MAEGISIHLTKSVFRMSHSVLCLPQSILLSDDTTDSDTDSDDSDFSLSREELQDMLRLHRFSRQHQSKFHSEREVQTRPNPSHNSLILSCDCCECIPSVHM